MQGTVPVLGVVQGSGLAKRPQWVGLGRKQSVRMRACAFRLPSSTSRTPACAERAEISDGHPFALRAVISATVKTLIFQRFRFS